MNIIDIKNNLHYERILAVISHSQYMPTEEKLNRLADKYDSNIDIFAYGYEDNDLVLGTIVLKYLGNDTYEILSIATDPAYRNQGIASRLISFSAANLKCSAIKAETDDDAVGFYRKYGFQIDSLGEKYPGTVRYLCTMNFSV